jgi:hypothetical protein
MIRSHVLVCGGTGCTSSGSAQIISALENEIEKQGLQDEVKVVRTGCFGLCALGPIMMVYPEGTLYSESERFRCPGDRLRASSQRAESCQAPCSMMRQSAATGVRSLSETPFYKKQVRSRAAQLRRHRPENIDEYIARDGYMALGKALTEMTPAEVIDVMKRSGLRGRGGADSRPDSSGNSPAKTRPTRNMSAATPMKATRARSWTVRCSKATRMQCSKAWPSPVTRSARTRATSTSAPNTRSPLSASDRYRPGS